MQISAANMLLAAQQAPKASVSAAPGRAAAPRFEPMSFADAPATATPAAQVQPDVRAEAAALPARAGLGQHLDIKV